MSLRKDAKALPFFFVALYIHFLSSLVILVIFFRLLFVVMSLDVYFSSFHLTTPFRGFGERKKFHVFALIVDVESSG